MCQPEGQEMSELLPGRQRSLVRLLLLLFKRQCMWKDGLWCTYSFWHLLSEYAPQSLASYLSAHTAMIYTMAWPRKIAYYMPWEVVDEMPHLADCRLGFFFNSSTFSLLTGLSPQWRKPHGTASKPAIALDPNAWTDSLLTARKWSGEFLLILL